MNLYIYIWIPIISLYKNYVLNSVRSRAPCFFSTFVLWWEEKCKFDYDSMGLGRWGDEVMMSWLCGKRTGGFPADVLLGLSLWIWRACVASVPQVFVLYSFQLVSCKKKECRREFFTFCPWFRVLGVNRVLGTLDVPHSFWSGFRIYHFLISKAGFVLPRSVFQSWEEYIPQALATRVATNSITDRMGFKECTKYGNYILYIDIYISFIYLRYLDLDLVRFI